MLHISIRHRGTIRFKGMEKYKVKSAMAGCTARTRSVYCSGKLDSGDWFMTMFSGSHPRVTLLNADPDSNGNRGNPGWFIWIEEHTEKEILDEQAARSIQRESIKKALSENTIGNCSTTVLRLLLTKLSSETVQEDGSPEETDGPDIKALVTDMLVKARALRKAKENIMAALYEKGKLNCGTEDVIEQICTLWYEDEDEAFAELSKAADGAEETRGQFM